MIKKLAELLGKSESEITNAISKLEAMNGYPSEDVRLLAENKQRLRVKITQLGLDPDDTTDEELYWALQTRFEKDSGTIDRALGVNEATGLDERVSKAAQLVNHCAQTDEMWVVKNPVGRRMLSQNPPKQVSKKMHYRSVASLLKREDVAEIHMVATVVESTTWRKAVSKQVAKLHTSDYELRAIKILRLPATRLTAVEGPDSKVVSDKRFGAVAIWPSSDLEKAPVLSLTLLLLSGLQAVNPDGYLESLNELSPALRWWADCSYLISDGDYSVSFNLKDIALNHLKKHDFKDALNHHGAHALWQELAGRYKQVSGALSDETDGAEPNPGQSFLNQSLPVSQELAAEYVVAEQE